MEAPGQAKILVNQLGYELEGAKKGVLAGPVPPGARGFSLLRQPGREVAFRGVLGASRRVDRWRHGSPAAALDFSACRNPGPCRLEVAHAAGVLRSAPFEVERDLLWRRTAPAVLDYFRGQRCTGILDEADRALPFTGDRNERVDVHGGWYDASGDRGKYLSHLSYTNFMNPQQTPLAVWSLLAAGELAAGRSGEEGLAAGLSSEAAYGADFLVRMQDPAGYFYMTVFDRWSADPAQRSICAFRGQEGIKSGDYRAGYRQGGGMAVAALSRAAAAGRGGEYPAGRYRAAAVRGFEHLQAYSLRYLEDRQENILDDACALLAAVELFRVQPEARFLEAARRRAASICARQVPGRPGGRKTSGKPGSPEERDPPAESPAWLRADSADRPFFHASDAGLPATALCRYLETEPEAGSRATVRAALERVLRFELAVTAEVDNPYGLARQRVRAVGGPVRHAFFMPHHNESGYWWQGENARLASLAAAARLGADFFPADPDFRLRLESYAADQLDWILGLNPFEACMLHGFGANNPEYEGRHPNAFGGICNGITAGFEDEHDLAFLPLPYAGQGEHRWRWSEQWLPHAAWYLLAVAAASPPDGGRP